MKYIILLLLTCLFVGCECREPAPVDLVGVKDDHCSIKILTVRGIKHEYIFYSAGSYGAVSGMTHLPNCKYCMPDSIKE